MVRREYGGIRMTKQEFWKQLTMLTQSQDTFPQLPALINKARAEDLSIPVKTIRRRDHIEPAVLEVQGKLFIECKTSLGIMQNDIVETDLVGFLEDLIDCGYHGIAFVTKAGLVGLEWKDFFYTSHNSTHNR